MDATSYGSFTATRRFVKPAASVPQASAASSLETSYQYTFFPQSDAPRATDPRYATKPIRGVRPASSVQKILQQSGTSTADFESTTKASFKSSTTSATRVVIAKKQEPKPQPTVYPVAIERTRVRGK